MHYIIDLNIHLEKLRKLRAFITDHAPRDSQEDLIPPFDAWVNTLELAIHTTDNCIHFFQLFKATPPSLTEPPNHTNDKGDHPCNAPNAPNG